jgi:hypothetical protein
MLFVPRTSVLIVATLVARVALTIVPVTDVVEMAMGFVLGPVDWALASSVIVFATAMMVKVMQNVDVQSVAVNVAIVLRVAAAASYVAFVVQAVDVLLVARDLEVGNVAMQMLGVLQAIDSNAMWA